MFIAHLPAGYLWSRFVLKRSLREDDRRHYQTYMGLGLFASILPDLDMFYFYFVDHRQHLHHDYWTHMPIFWLAILLFSIVAAGVLRSRMIMMSSVIIISNCLLHLFLDTVVGKIKWLYPLIKDDFVFFTVPAQYHWWVWNFVLHWTFIFELGLVFSALFMFLVSRRKTVLAQDYA